MNPLQKDLVTELLQDREPPCLSLYQPTHRHRPENQQDPIRFLNLVKVLEESLLQKYAKRDVQALLDPFKALAEDHGFWEHTLDGLVVLGARDLFRVHRLQRPVAELAVVADTFHTRPLLRVLQSDQRYQILGLSRREIRLYEGDRDVLDEMEPAAGIPRTMTEALGEELTEPHHTVASYGGVGGAHPAMHHGQGGKGAEVDIDAERFFRAIDRGILEHHSRPSGLPLILATLPEHRQLFRRISHNPFLMEEGIDSHPDALSLDDLRRRAWQLVEPHYMERLVALAEKYGEARAKDLADEDLDRVAKAVVAGRVDILLIEAGRQFPGRIDAATGDREVGDWLDPEVDEVLDDLTQLTLKMGGEALVVPSEHMPTQTGVAAIYRY